MTLLEKETTPQNPYNYISDNEKTWYSFVTKNGVHYEVTFLKSPALFHQYPDIGGLIYEMSILTAYENPPLDHSVQLTVIEISKDFFNNNRNVLLFVCDSLDDCHLKRKNKFNRWFNNSDIGDDYEKHDGCINESGIEIHNTIILKKDFELKKNILEAFFEINHN